MDPVELRMRNLVREGSLLSVGTPLPKGVSIPQVVADCASASGWEQTPGVGWKRPGGKTGGKFELQTDQPHLKRGVGFACAYKNVGFSFGAPEQCTATVELYGAAEIERRSSATPARMCGRARTPSSPRWQPKRWACLLRKLQLIVSDTAQVGNSGSASASRMTFMAGNAIKGAAEAALENWHAEERPAVATFQYRPPNTTPFDPQTGKSEPNFAYGYVAQAVLKWRWIPKPGRCASCDVVSANDVGQAVNPQQVQGQIEGGGRPGGGLRHPGEFRPEGWLRADPAPVHLPDPYRAGCARTGGSRHPGISRPDWAVRGARHGGDALSCRWRRRSPPPCRTPPGSGSTSSR